MLRYLTPCEDCVHAVIWFEHPRYLTPEQIARITQFSLHEVINALVRLAEAGMLPANRTLQWKVATFILSIEAP